MKYISPIQLNEIIESDTPTMIVNVLPHHAYMRHHIPNSTNYDVNDPKFISNIEASCPAKETAIILYGIDNTLMRPKMAVHRLEKLGYKNCLVLKGGLEEWESEGYVTITN
ncbi:rhodanese-like domain-containing protein [Halosquirtibacter xylanolyticus]|uniref:rhodanese-like domain-containing protein n=1 Tax=Halosquirtibacter xylanolyticus TaxID=3374599 RepID=UPI00374926B9|nr:rhodanese-like domain-containing protein [Prolixibacteraceae bacterium]